MSQEATSSMKAIPKEDRPRERLLRSGAAALSDAELVAVLLRVGRRGQSAMAMARELLAEFGGLTGLPQAKPEALVRPGLGTGKATMLLAAIELGRRLARARIPPRQLLDRPDKVANYLILRYGNRDQEVMGALYLDVHNRLIAEVDLYRGTLSRTAVEPRLVLKQALQRGAAGFVLFHNHPSGDPTPSVEDLCFTRQLAKAADQVGVRMHDHLIIGSGGRWVSLNRRGGW
jgi:DNA repair protein RadC